METDAHPTQPSGWKEKIQISAAIALFLSAAIVGSAEPATFATRVAPILDQHCTVCHGTEKQKAKLRVDTLAALLAGSENGAVLTAGDPPASELFRRVILPETDEDVMPSDGKPHLSEAEIAVLEKWILAGAPATAEFDAPALAAAIVVPPAAPDYAPRLAAATKLANQLGIRLVPRSRVPTDGLILRTASAPSRCDDQVLTQLAPYADLIVEAELARTKVTDTGLASIATWKNLTRLDLTRTAVTSAGVPQLASLTKLVALNLSQTKIDATGLTTVRAFSSLKEVWAFDTAAEPAAIP